MDSAFLPQDKVAEFAQMSPQQLLVQTQLAAGDKNLSSWHETLIKLGKETKILETVCSNSDGLYLLTFIGNLELKLRD